MSLVMKKKKKSIRYGHRQNNHESHELILISIHSINVRNIRVEFNILEVVHLLNEISLYLYEVSLFIELDDVPFPM